MQKSTALITNNLTKSTQCIVILFSNGFSRNIFSKRPSYIKIIGADFSHNLNVKISYDTRYPVINLLAHNCLHLLQSKRGALNEVNSKNAGNIGE